MAKTLMIEVFKAGKQTDSAGNTKEWTEADLDKIVSETQKLGESVPWTIGHPKTDAAPAFAWCEKVVRKGKSLFAEMRDITSELSDMLKKKMFKNRSIAMRPNFSLRHIALLGAEPPAVKGLEAFNFKSEDEYSAFDACFLEDPEFACGKKKHSKLFQALEGLIKQFRDDSDDDEMEMIPEFKEQNPETTKGESMDIKELETKIETLEAQNKEFAEKLTGLEEENKNLKAEKEASEKSLAEFKETTKRNEFGAWYDGIVKAGKALPANKEATVNTMMILDGQEAMDFSEGEKTVKKTPLELFKSQAEAAEKVVEYSEFAEKNKAKTRDASTQEKEFQEKISKRMKEASLEYGEAMRQVTMENPELAEAVERNAYE